MRRLERFLLRNFVVAVLLPVAAGSVCLTAWIFNTSNATFILLVSSTVWIPVLLFSGIVDQRLNGIWLNPRRPNADRAEPEQEPGRYLQSRR